MPVLAQLKRSALLFLFAWGIMLQPALTPAGFAHANVVRSNPAANSVLEQPPAAVTIWFTEPLEAQLSHIQVLDSQGRRVDTGHSLVDGVDPTQLSVELLPLPQGTYVVAWTNVSTVDGHKVRGSFVFAVGEPLNPAVTAAPAPPATLQSPLEPVLRWLSLLTVLFVTGGLAFELLILRPCLHRGDADDVPRRLGQMLATRMLKAIWPALGLLVLASVGQLLLQTMITFEVSLPQALGQPLLTVMLETGWGRLWLVRMALLLMMPAVIDLAITAPTSPRLESSRPMLLNQLPRFTAVGLGAGLLLTLSLTSHAAATPEIRVAAIFNDYLHLLAASFWAGSLLHFALGAPLLARHLPASGRRELLSAMVARFSVLAGLSVTVLFVTGLFSAYAQVTIWPALRATLYGQILLVKGGLILPLLALGALNLLWVRPRLARQARAGVWLRRFVTAEAVLVVLVLLPVGLLTALEPARQVASREGLGQPDGLMFQDTVEGTDIALAIEPGHVGANRLRVALADHRGKPITNAAEVSVRATFMEADLGESAVTATGEGSGTYEVGNQMLNIAGPWQVELVVRRPDALDARTAFRFEATPAGAVNSATIAPAARAGHYFWAGELALLGALLVAVGLRGRGWRHPAGLTATIPGGVALVAAVWLAFNPPAPTSAQPATPPVDEPAAANQAAPPVDPLRNPFLPDAASLGVGLSVFEQNCTPCHGLTGRGDGPLAATLNPPPADLLTHISLHPDIELFRLVRDGKTFTAMPAFADKLSAAQMWHLVNYLRAFEVDLRLAENHYRRGQGMLEQGNAAEALLSFEAALRLMPNHVWATIDRGVAYRQLGQIEAALADHNRAVELRPDLADAYFNRGVDYNQMHQPEQAVADYGRAIEIDPGFTSAYYARGLAYTDSGQPVRAVRDFDRALQLYPEFKRVYLDRGLAHLDSGDLFKARADLNKYLELLPEAENRASVADLVVQLDGALATEPTQSLPASARTPDPGGN